LLSDGRTKAAATTRTMGMLFEGVACVDIVGLFKAFVSSGHVKGALRLYLPNLGGFNCCEDLTNLVIYNLLS